MEDEEEVMIMNYSEIDFPAPIHTKSEFQDESDYVGYEDCKEEFDLEQMLENGEVTPMETKCEDWEMLEAEICSENLDHSDRHKEQNELIIKHDDDDISDISLLAHNEDRSTETEALGTETNTDEATEEIALGGSPIRPRKKQSADGEYAASSIQFVDMTTFVDAVEEHNSQPTLKKKKVLFKCDQCDFSTGIRFALTRHQIHHSSRSSKVSRKTPDASSTSSGEVVHKKKEKLLFKCPRSNCSFCTFNRKSFTLHVLTHDSSKKAMKIVKCEHCSAALTPTGLLLHMRQQHKDQSVKCIKCHQVIVKRQRHHCQSVAKTVSKLKSNTSLSNQKDERLFKCQCCSFSTKFRFILKRHLIQNHQKSEALKDLKCRYCSFEPKSTRSLIIHVVKSHTEHCKRCEFCCRLVPSGRKKEHLLTCIMKKQQETKQKVKSKTKQQHKLTNKATQNDIITTRIKCKLCSYTINSGDKARFKQHLERHAKNQQMVKCEKCHFASFPKIVDYHFIQKHRCVDDDNGKVYTCKSCPYITKRVDYYNKHCISHGKNTEDDKRMDKSTKATDERLNFKCKKCSYSTHSCTTFKDHLKAHLKNCPVKQCPQCDFRATEVALNFHVKKSHGVEVKDEKGDKTKSEGLHCNYCPRVIVSVRYLRSHITKSHKQSIIPCRFCKETIPKQIRLKHVMRCPKNPLDLPSRDTNFQTELVQCKYCSHKVARRLMYQHVYMHTRRKAKMVKCEQCDFKSSLNVVRIHNKSAHSLPLADKSFNQQKLGKEKNVNLDDGSKTTKVVLEPKNNSSTSVDCLKAPTADVKKHNLEVTPEEKCDDQHDFLGDFVEKVSFKGNNSYRCRICSISAKYKYEMQRHLRTHTEVTLSGSQTKDLPKKDHDIVTVSSNFVFICEFCDFATQSKDALLRHKTKHSASRPPTLSIASKSDSNTSVFTERHNYPLQDRTHLQRKFIPSSIGNIYCAENLPSSTSTGFSKHKTFNGLTSLDDYKLIPNVDSYTVGVNGKWVQYYCNQCPYKTLEKDIMFLHVKEHGKLQETPFKCPFCGHRASSKSQLQVHIFAKHRPDDDVDEKLMKVYKCDACEFQSCHESQYKNHKLLHVNINDMKVYQNGPYSVERSKRRGCADGESKAT